MQGKEPTDIPVPQSPQLLPSTTDLPFLTWRGSAGAGGYNIERAENPNGPWIMIGENVSDANVAYRPLFNDESALANHDYYYRVSALNSSGISSPSNILGPVRFRSQLFVDEFQNLDKIKQKSDGIEYDNDFNGLYGEYLFRLKGKNEEAIIYELPGNVSSIKVWSFFEDDIRTPMILVSSADENFTSLQVSRVKEQNLVSFDKVSQLRGLKRVLVVHKADVIQDINNARFVKIQWDGLMELDRVEIEFSK
jgi:hypothetical protein